MAVMIIIVVVLDVEVGRSPKVEVSRGERLERQSEQQNRSDRDPTQG